jgi:alpha-N-arabinofuranosidase
MRLEVLRERRFRPRVAGAVVVLLTGLVAVPGAASAAGTGRLQWDEVPVIAQVEVQARPLGTISRYLFGANLLWADDAEGAFDQSTGTFYPAFVSLLRRVGVTVLRYPGGTTSDSFRWLRAVGPERDRQANEPYGMQAATISDICCVLDGPAPSTVGPDEFGRLLDETGAAGTITVNFATGTAQEAADFVAYMTAPKSRRPSSDPVDPSYWAALRANNGHPGPYNVPYWEVGNEQFFPGQYGWRSGGLVRLGPHSGPCPTGEVATCLYAFGGTTSFSRQAVGTFADELPSASYSTGRAHQTFSVYFPPVVPHSATVYVSGKPWAEVANLADAGRRAEVYALQPSTGAISFGDGTHGEVPPKGAKVTVSYDSGPHGGFVEFYRAMKAMNPRIDICESEGRNLAFLALMGDRHPYDCVVLHEYARPADIAAPLVRYEEQLMAFPAREGEQLGALQEAVRRYSGRDIPVVLTEYGQLVAPVPAADPQFNLSLDEGLLVGAQLVEWADRGIPVAEKYLLDSAPFPSASLAEASRVSTASSVKALSIRAVHGLDKARVATGLSVDSALVAHEGREFVAEPSGQVLALMARLAGAQRLPATVADGPAMTVGKERVPALWLTAGVSPTRQLELVVVNAEPSRPVRAKIVLLHLRHMEWLQASVLDGPSATAYNSVLAPDEVTTADVSRDVGSGNFDWTFPAHSVSLLRLDLSPPALRV